MTKYLLLILSVFATSHLQAQADKSLLNIQRTVFGTTIGKHDLETSLMAFIGLLPSGRCDRKKYR